MWRFLNIIPRAFRQQCHSPRASIGVHVDDNEQDCQHLNHEPSSNEKSEAVKECHDGILSKSKELFSASEVEVGEHTEQVKRRNYVCSAVKSLLRIWDPKNEGFISRYIGQQEITKEGKSGKTNFRDFYTLLENNHLLEILAVGSYFGWGSENKGTSNTRLLRRVFSISFGFNPLNLNRNEIPPQISVSLPTAVDESEKQTQHSCCDSNITVKVPEQICPQIKADSDSNTESIESALSEFQDICKEYSSRSESLLGLEAAEYGDMLGALQHLKNACSMGNVSACFNVGLCYETGSGVEKNIDKAVEFYEKAARNGHCFAKYNLGLIYLNGYDSETDSTRQRGMFLIEEAANMGLAEAQTQMGILCMEQERIDDACKYFIASANQSDCEARYFLAMCYEQGLGMHVDLEKSVQFYSLAADAGHQGATYNLAVFSELGLGGLSADRNTATDLYQKAADAGHALAQSRLDVLAAEKVEKQREEDEKKAQEKVCTSERRSRFSTYNLSISLSSLNLIGRRTDITSLLIPVTSITPASEGESQLTFISPAEKRSQGANKKDFYIGEEDGADLRLKPVNSSLFLNNAVDDINCGQGHTDLSYPMYGHLHKSYTSPSLSTMIA